MNKQLITFIESYKIKWYDLTLYSKKISILFIDLLKENNYKVDWFDGFKIYKDWKYQIDQDYSRDYSNFSFQDSYSLTKEYFLKSKRDDIYYTISYRKICIK